MTTTHITNKQKEILNLIPQFRFLNSKHIQQFLNHKDKKTINTWLKDLLQKDYIEKVEQQHKQFPPQPAIYRIGKQGIAYLKGQGRLNDSFLKNLYRDKDRSFAFNDTCFLLATICLQLQSESQQTDTKEIFEYFTKSDYSFSNSLFHFLQLLHPHLCFTKKVTGRKKSWYLLEIFPNTIQSTQIRQRIHAFVRFLAEEEWKEKLGNNTPTIFFVCTTKQILSYIRQYTRKKLQKFEIENTDISFALEEDIKSVGIRGEIWKELVYTLNQ